MEAVQAEMARKAALKNQWLIVIFLSYQLNKFVFSVYNYIQVSSLNSNLSTVDL